ncbi:MAG: trigger factor [Thermoguttaceae bacterium]|nr:trigger factor [Thermoguttaceae bacterium]
MAESENTQVDGQTEGQNPEEETKKAPINMDVDIQEVSSCQRHIKVTIPREEVDKFFEQEFDELSEKAIVPGFRVGKAPRKIVEKRFKKDISDRVKQTMLLDSLAQISESKDFTPISEPDLDIMKIVLPKEGPFIYEYNIEVRPNFDLPNWKGLKIDKPVHEVSAADIDKAIDRVLENNGSLVDSDAPAAMGDYIRTSLTFSYEGKDISSAESELIRVRPKLSFHDGVIADFGKKMTGVKPGDTIKAKAQLTDSTADASLRGKQIDATFVVKEVKKLEKPELNDDFIKLFGFSDMGDFRDMVEESLKRQIVTDQRRTARRQISEKLTGAVQFDLPPELLKRQASRELQRAILELRRNGLEDADILPQINFLRQNSQRTTAQALKEHFIFEKIAETENIEDTDVDYEMEIALLAAQANVTTRKIRSQIEKAGDMDILRNQIIERKVLDLILSEAQFKEVPWKPQDLSDEEAIDRAAGSDEVGIEEEIPEVTEEENKETARQEATKPLTVDDQKKHGRRA